MQAQLRVILEAEAEARRRLEAARAESAALAARAAEEARALVREACEAREVISREAEERLVAAARERAAGIGGEALARVGELRTRAASRMDRAIDLVLQAVLGGGEHAR